jgi:hypothetical protein
MILQQGPHPCTYSQRHRSQPNAINDFGEIFGYAWITLLTATNFSGFVISPKGDITILNYDDSAPDAFPGPKGPQLLKKGIGTTSIFGGNNAGQFVGFGVESYSDGILGIA